MFNTDLTFEVCSDKVIKNPSTFTSGGGKNVIMTKTQYI